MSGAHVFIDRSQFPESVRRDLLQSLRTRAINHKFHYDSYKQASKWLALHEAYSPARHDASCARIYDEAFTAAVNDGAADSIHVVGLGCGGGQKEARLAQLLHQRQKLVKCTLSDVSVALVLTAREAVKPFTEQCDGIVCDLITAEDDQIFGGTERRRIVTLFGIIPNFEPRPLLCRIAKLLRANDRFLLSANLAPGPDYLAGVERILPQYDNPLTRDWLMTLLLDLGFEHSDGRLDFTIETDGDQLKRIAAYFKLCRGREICVFGEPIPFQAGERIRLFFSYRYMPETLTVLLREFGIRVRVSWSNDSGEEGVFVCDKAM